MPACVAWIVTIKSDEPPFRLKRKIEAWSPSEQRGNYWRFIDTIKEVEPEDSVCISVDAEDGLYVTKDFILTHNTSVLDSIWWALAGASNVQAVPIRAGQTQARIQLDLGEIVVTRTFKDRDGEFTTQITVENSEGARYPSPQKLLDTLLGSLSFDPLAFTRMDPRKQFDALRQFVPGIDFDEIELANKADYDKRTTINRQAKEARTAGEIIQVAADLPDDDIDEAALVAELEAAGQHNSTIEIRTERRSQAAARVAALRAEAGAIVDALPAAIEQIRSRAADRAADIAQQIDTLERQIAALRTRASAIEDEATAAASEANDQADKSRQTLFVEADELQAKLDAAGEIPAPIDTAALRARIATARSVNEGITMRRKRTAHLARAEELEAASRDLTATMAKRETDKQAAIAAAKLPVEGIGFGEGHIMLNGLPFNQASDAEQLRASIAIAMASNPKLRVIRVRDGSLLDEDGLRLLAEMADAHDCQVWCELVRSDGKVGFVLEDGQVKAKGHAQTDLLSAAE